LAQGLGVVIFAAKVGDIDITAMAAAKVSFANVLVSMELSPIFDATAPGGQYSANAEAGQATAVGRVVAV
jgi:hypothetical protein